MNITKTNKYLAAEENLSLADLLACREKTNFLEKCL